MFVVMGEVWPGARTRDRLTGHTTGTLGRPGHKAAAPVTGAAALSCGGGKGQWTTSVAFMPSWTWQTNVYVPGVAVADTPIVQVAKAADAGSPKAASSALLARSPESETVVGL